MYVPIRMIFYFLKLAILQGNVVQLPLYSFFLVEMSFSSGLKQGPMVLTSSWAILNCPLRHLRKEKLLNDLINLKLLKNIQLKTSRLKAIHILSPYYVLNERQFPVSNRHVILITANILKGEYHKDQCWYNLLVKSAEAFWDSFSFPSLMQSFFFKFLCLSISLPFGFIALFLRVRFSVTLGM